MCFERSIHLVNVVTDIRILIEIIFDCEQYTILQKHNISLSFLLIYCVSSKCIFLVISISEKIHFAPLFPLLVLIVVVCYNLRMEERHGVRNETTSKDNNKLRQWLYNDWIGKFCVKVYILKKELFYRTFRVLYFSTELFSVSSNEIRSVVFLRCIFRFRRVKKVSFSFDKTTWKIRQHSPECKTVSGKTCGFAYRIQNPSEFPIFLAKFQRFLHTRYEILQSFVCSIQNPRGCVVYRMIFYSLYKTLESSANC